MLFDTGGFFKSHPLLHFLYPSTMSCDGDSEHHPFDLWLPNLNEFHVDFHFFPADAYARGRTDA